MFYVLIGQDGYASWWSGFLSFSITAEDVLSMYREAKHKEPAGITMVMQIEDTELANKIMTKKAHFDNKTSEWSFEELPKVEVTQQQPTQIEQLQQQVKYLTEKVNQLSTQ